MFDSTKNSWLIKTREISFEMVIAVLEKQGPLRVIEHSNREKYLRQKMYVVELNGYAYLVPFLEEADKIILKTIYPNRKATKHYLKIEDDKNE